MYFTRMARPACAKVYSTIYKRECDILHSQYTIIFNYLKKLTTKQHILLLIPSVWACLIDETVTVIYQSKEYWSGNLSAGNEANPIGGFMMRQHVSGIFIVNGAWLLAVILLGYYLPRKYARPFLLFVLIAHTAAGSSWLVGRFPFMFVIAYYAFNSIAFHLVERAVFKEKLESAALI